MKPTIIMTQSTRYQHPDAHVLHLPFIKISPLSLPSNFNNQSYDWLILTSKNAVTHFKPYLDHIHYKKLAVIGEKTKQLCHDLGLKVDFCPKDFSQEGFLEAFHGKEGRVLIPSSLKARPKLAETLRNRGLEVTKLDLYEPIAHDKHIQEAIQLIESNLINALTFASSSSARYYFSKGGDTTFQHYYVIGHETLKTVESYGASAKVAPIQTLDAMMQTILRK
ncbi:uroporphyrinogen-III synthase [Staphylococcus massiliensis]|uniref:Uroporphyrinogen-III synthase n=1 Tax=Staphylococcus massiliensis S46 TaxID=1229783 RepID=K9B5R0_9STAP|nr:uroporphyrinogen-III synthase [Staphylococcus massiliensis]EKU50177.1 uroporphyrinogen III synthase [Staphylococcus massiliensis S46]MCG3399103.1 uroporphyrinogen-III synthase [Staphylococcus massiliensis]MCG3400899.1 uroporphyrinogen-III synthase [Staphylococcus massiliensis]POA01660.1 uroporphyrinogen-III synthase [Staphylococcus massiliensis CCUG 55927]